MPETSSEIVWYAFQASMLLVIWLVRNDIREIKAEIKASREKADKNELEIATHKSACEERHKRLDFEIAAMKGKP